MLLTHFELSCSLLCSLHLPTELLLDVGRGAAQWGDGEVALVQLAGQLGHLLPHPVHLPTVSLLGRVKLFSQLQNESTEVISKEWCWWVKVRCRKHSVWVSEGGFLTFLSSVTEESCSAFMLLRSCSVLEWSALSRFTLSSLRKTWRGKHRMFT